MNDTLPTNSQLGAPVQNDAPFRPHLDPDKGDDFNIGLILADVWEGRYLILGAMVLFAAMGILYAFSSTPVYQVEGLLQTETTKNYGARGTEFTKMEGLYSLPTVAQGEIEILKSNLVLGRVVEILGLDVETGPIVSPIFGKLRMYARGSRPRLDVESFQVPERLKGKRFKLLALPEGGYRLIGPDDTAIGQGVVGQRLEVTYGGNLIRLMVRNLRATPGQAFNLTVNPMVDAINDLRLGLQVEERGKNAYASSNILWLSLQGSDPDKAAVILNETLNQYIRQAVERKSGESSKALALLQNQRPMLQAQLAEAEGRLNAYRRQTGAVDLVREGQLFLEQGSSMDAQISALRQKRQELLRTYTEHSDQVVTIDNQLARLQGEAKRIDQKVTALPATQQEIVRLTRDAQVKSEMYTSLLSSIQQLQNTLAGSVGNARVVDYAIPNYDAVAPRKKVLIGLFLFMGAVAGTGLTALRRLLRRGIEDHRVIETKLGMQVLVTIPHAIPQKVINRAIRSHEQGIHILAVQEPEDMATESLRSLRTVLHFIMEGTGNHLVMITGPAPEIGKSFVSANLATVLAQGGSRVLLVDADLRKGNLHRTFGFKGRAGGLSEVLAGRAEWQALVKPTEIPGLSLLCTGLLPPDPLVLLMAPRFTEFTTQVSEAYDFVIIDAPPILPVTDAQVIGAKVEAILMIAKYAKHPIDELRVCQNRLKNLGGKLKGYVFNDIKLVGVGGVYGYYKYEFDYKYRKGES